MRSSDVTRADTVTLNVVFTIFRADIASQHLQTAFGSSVSRYSFTTQLRHHRADVDDFTGTLLHHGRQHSLRNDERSVQVDINHTTEVSSFHFVHRNTADNTGVINKDINRTYFFLDSSNHCLNSRFVCHVAYITVSFNSLFSIGSHAFVYQLLVDVVKTYSSALFCVSRSNCKTDTVRSTCNESYFTFQRKIQILIHNFLLLNDENYCSCLF